MRAEILTGAVWLYRPGMTRVFYAVTATLPDEAMAREYVEWLEGGHVRQVIEGGAESGFVVRVSRRDGDGLSPEARQVMSVYIFPTREHFERYERLAAPALREDGRRKFGPERGVSMARTLGDVV